MTTFDVAAFPFIDNPHAPLLLADAVAGIRFAEAGQMRITFEHWHVNFASDPASISRVCSGCLIMSLELAEALANDIQAALADRRDRAARTMPAGETTQ